MLAAWLDTVRGGMGEHVSVLVEYGVESFQDMCDVDEDDIARINFSSDLDQLFLRFGSRVLGGVTVLPGGKN